LQEPESSLTEHSKLAAVTNELQPPVQMEMELPQQIEGHFWSLIYCIQLIKIFSLLIVKSIEIQCDLLAVPPLKNLSYQGHTTKFLISSAPEETDPEETDLESSFFIS